MLQRCDATHQLNLKCIFLCISDLHFELLGARLGSGPRTETEQPFCSVCSVHFQVWRCGSINGSLDSRQSKKRKADDDDDYFDIITHRFGKSEVVQDELERYLKA